MVRENIAFDEATFYSWLDEFAGDLTRGVVIATLTGRQEGRNYFAGFAVEFVRSTADGAKSFSLVVEGQGRPGSKDVDRVLRAAATFFARAVELRLRVVAGDPGNSPLNRGRG